VDDGTLDWLAFHLTFLSCPAAGRRALERFGRAAALLGASPPDLEGLRLPAQAFHAVTTRRALADAEAELEKVRAKAYTLLTLEDPGYPSRLGEIFDPPPVLYCAGRAEALADPVVAIVGSRRPTPYGRALAERLAGDLAARGCAVVSGLAVGIDTCAHWGALREGRTIAVLGSGLDVLYPWVNRGLAEKIMERGAVVTEFPLGTPPLQKNFPVRNRIISGLALGLVVAEAAERSGSLISAGFALDQGREVMAVPGSVTSEQSRGANRLIKSGAKLVEGWEDVAEELPPPWREKLLAQKDNNVDNSRDSLSDDERRLMSELAADAAVHVDDLAERTNMPVSGLLALLLGLELRGLVVQHPGKLFQRSI
jgi:DNA processing protein